jgi:hypothetical protein
MSVSLVSSSRIPVAGHRRHSWSGSHGATFGPRHLPGSDPPDPTVRWARRAVRSRSRKAFGGRRLS